MPLDSTVPVLFAFQLLLLSPTTPSVFEVTIAAAGLLTTFFHGFLPGWQRTRDRTTLKRHLDGLYSEATIAAATQCYLDPFCQSLDPAGAEEPRLAFCARQNIFEALEEAFNHPTAYRYLILLADSGMGKTSVLLNYYARHLRRRRRAFELALVPLSLPDVQVRINAIENQSKTVLLLDGLDEDALAAADHAARLRELIKLTLNFRSVLITCNTQFFANDEELPREAGVLKIDSFSKDGKAQHVFHKLYLSPFTEKQVEAYLQRRYSCVHRQRRRRAAAWVEKSPHLFARPLLLANLDEVMASKRKISHSFELYEEMIEAWLQREAATASGLQQKYLRQFLERLAFDLYRQREQRGAEHISRPELTQLAQTWGIPVDEWQLTSRSLLNRDSAGNCKFAHRSMMEYLLVKKFAAGDSASRNLAWTPQMRNFLWEMIQHHLAIKKPVSFDIKTADLKGFWLPLRGMALSQLEEEQAQSMLAQNNFFDRNKNPQGTGITHLYESSSREGGRLMIDHATGLVWQNSDMSELLNFEAAWQQITTLNQQRCAGFDDWRLPTLEEAMSLVERKKQRKELHLAQTFERTPAWIWTADRERSSVAWAVDFRAGACVLLHVNDHAYVRAVR